MNCIRHYACKEPIDVAHRGFLHRLEAEGVLGAEVREKVIDRLLKARKRSDEELSAKEIAWLVVMTIYSHRLGFPFDVLWSRPEIQRNYSLETEH